MIKFCDTEFADWTFELGNCCYYRYSVRELQSLFVSYICIRPRRRFYPNDPDDLWTIHFFGEIGRSFRDCGMYDQKIMRGNINQVKDDVDNYIIKINNLKAFM